jgi:hypothetical protein
MVAQSVAVILGNRVKLSVECIDRMYLNVYVPKLQREKDAAWFFRGHRQQPFASSALMAPMSRRFVAGLERYAEVHGIDLVQFPPGERKDDVMAERLKRFDDAEGVVFIGKAQEKASVFRTEKRRSPNGQSYPWIVRSTAMVNRYYIYAVDRDFGPSSSSSPATSPTTPSSASTATNTPSGSSPAKASPSRRSQRRATLQAGHRFEKAHDLVRAQHHRQLARLASIRDAFRQLVLTQRHAVEEAQCTDGLVERRPGDAPCNELHLIGAHGFHIQPVRRAAKILTELRHRVDVRSLRRRRQIADRHVLDHAATKRA